MSTLRATKAPNLINAPRVYEAGYYDQTYRELRTYFNTLDNVTSALFGALGGDYLTFSYGSFYDTTDQTAVSTTVAYAITLNTTDISQGVSIASSSQLTFADAGVYNIQFSIQRLAYQLLRRTLTSGSGRTGRILRTQTAGLALPPEKESVIRITSLRL